MKKIIVLIFSFVLLTSISFAECNENTKAKVDYIKSTIPYPKWNMGDIAYIAFINDPSIGTDNFTDRDIMVLRVKIVGMKLYNSIGGTDFADGLYLEEDIEDFPLMWKYQYLDVAIPNPKYRDFSDFISEDQFQKTPKDAKLALRRICK